MPFTPAHPAIVLPFLKKRYVSATALIVGSVSPDFEYFLKARVNSIHGHTLPGIFYFDLPVILFLSLAFHLVVKPSLISNLPVFLQRRLVSLKQFDFKSYLTNNFLVFITSALLGAASHIFWDSFTHNGTYFVENLPMYQGSYIPFQGAKYPLWYAMQFISTITGLTLIVMYILFLPVEQMVAVSKPRLTYWLSLLMAAGLFFVIRFTLITERFDLGNIVVTSISSLLLATVVVSLMPYFKTVPIKNS